MKWPVLFIAFLAILPIAAWLRRNPQHVPKVWLLMGILPFAVDPLHLYMAIISWPMWPGFVKGTEVSVIDILAIAIYISLPRATSALPCRLSMAAYFVAVLLSAFQANFAEAALFYAWQLARMFLLYAVVTRASNDDRVVASLLKGMTIGICFEACTVVLQKFAFGQFQPGGTFGHQNALGMVSHFVVFPCFALLLAGNKGWTLRLAPMAGTVVAILTASRATIGLAALGYVTLFAISAMHKWTLRKRRLAVAFALAIAVMVPVAIASLETRFSVAANEDDYDERAALELAAASILSDNPTGIGANHYVVTANTLGYNERAKVAPTSESLSAHVHNVYFVVADETGYLGLITFLILLMQPLIIAFVWGWRSQGDTRGDLLLGFGVSLVIVYIHSLYEWIFVVHFLQYYFALACGCIVGVAGQLGYRRRKVQVGSIAPVGPQKLFARSGDTAQSGTC